MTARTLIDLAGAQASWWACALGAGAGLWWPGATVSLAVVALQLAISSERRPLVATVAAAAAIGLAIETILVLSGFLTFAAATPAIGVAPVWMVALWMAFATSIGPMSRALAGRPLALVALLGAVVAPPTYAVAQKFGALTLGQPTWAPLLAIAVLWAIALPALELVWRSACRGGPWLQTGSPPP